MFDPQPDEVSVSIPWHPWRADAFRLAQESDRPILLSISAVWCHWCHVMDKGTLRDPEVIRRVVSETVPIRVDSDQRPDINSRYNLGGWPTTAFLTPEGDLLTGGTFMPPDEFLSVLDEVTGYCREQRADLRAKVERRRARRARISELRHRLRGSVTPEIVNTVVEALRQAYDAEHGGFGPAPKFPLPDTIALAMAVGQTDRDQGLLDMARTTLQAMAEGGLADRVSGGFFRYSTTRDWGRPHYEKLLDGNARLLDAYLQAARVFGLPLFWETARSTMAFAEAVLLDEEMGAFWGSAAADEEYYHLRADARALRPSLPVDQTIVTDWNAMMASALLEAGAVLDEPYYGEVGLQAVDALWTRNWDPEAGMAHFYDGAPQAVGMLSDQAWMGRALLDAHAYTGGGDYLERAEALMRTMIARLADPDAGGFYDIPFDPVAQGRLQERLKPVPENAYAADLALRLHRLTGKDKHYEAAAGTLAAIAPLYRAYRHHAAPYALAVYRFVHHPLHLIVVGDPLAEQSRRLRKVALSVYDPNRLVETVDPQCGATRLQQLGLLARPSPALYVRRGELTSPPVEDPAQVCAAIQAVPA